MSEPAFRPRAENVSWGKVTPICEAWITRKNKGFQDWMYCIPKPILTHRFKLGTLRIQREATAKSPSATAVSEKRKKYLSFKMNLKVKIQNLIKKANPLNKIPQTYKKEYCFPQRGDNKVHRDFLNKHFNILKLIKDGKSFKYKTRWLWNKNR